MFYSLVGVLLAFGVLAIVRDWLRWRDVFHPTIYCVPQLLFLYVLFPVYGLATDEYEFLSRGGYWDELDFFQFAVTLVCFAMICGIWSGCRATRAVTRPIATENTPAIFWLACLFGLAGVCAWLVGIINVGGFGTAYGRAYGGGWDDSGYVREAAQLGFLATPLLIFSRRIRGTRPRHWLLVLLFISPLLVQGALGARRGPTFLALVGVAGSYILVFRPRIPFLVAAGGATVVGVLMLWLVANRGAIYLGSEKQFDGSVSMMLENWSANEYLFSSAIFRYVNETGEPFYGRRILAHMGGRIVPAVLWPTKYTDVVAAVGLDIDLTQRAGLPVERMATITGWDVAAGAAPGLVGDFWMEFGWLAPLAAFSIGWFYGRLWRVARSEPRLQPVYVLMAALSIYLITQTIEAWLFRALLFGIPAALSLRWLEKRLSVRRTDTGYAQP